MKAIRWNSVHARLILWNVGVLALVLSGFGVALCYRVQADALALLDRDLAGIPRHLPHGPPRSHHWGSGPRPDGFDRGPGPRLPDWEGGPGPEGPPSFSLNRDGSHPPASAAPLHDAAPLGISSSATALSPFDAEAMRAAEFFFPRCFTLDGRPVNGSSSPPWDPRSLTLAAAAGGREVYSTVQLDGQPVRVLSAPLFHDGQVFAVLQFARPLTEQKRLAASQLRTLGALIPLALLVASLGGIFLTDRALRPVRNITHAAAEIGAADLSRRLEVTGQDEFAELAATFNGMIARLDEAFRNLENAYQRLETAYLQQQRFTADASHELRTPLTRIKASVSLALSGQRDAAAYRKSLQTVDDAAGVMSQLIQDLLLLARADAAQLRLELRPLPVAELLEEAVEALPEGWNTLLGAKPAPAGEPYPSRRGCHVRIQPPPEPLGLLGDWNALTRLLQNLLANARRHTPGDGQITLSGRREASGIVLCVEDTGEGIPPEHLPHVCERFYRVDDARARSAGGAGLGLAICHSIAQAHGGTLTIESVLGRGTTVCVTLPDPGQLAIEAAEDESVEARA